MLVSSVWLQKYFVASVLWREERTWDLPLHEHSGMAMKSAPGEGIALCVDSLWRFSPEDLMIKSSSLMS
jgi:hypothetical protein